MQKNAADVGVPIAFNEIVLFVFLDLHLMMVSIHNSLSLLRGEFWKFILVREFIGMLIFFNKDRRM